MITANQLVCHVVWAKNFLAPRAWRYPWNECAGTGYYKERPAWLSVWLMIIADNVLHVLLNGLALRYL